MAKGFLSEIPEIIIFVVFKGDVKIPSLFSLSTRIRYTAGDHCRHFIKQTLLSLW